MKYLRTISALPARAADNFDDPADDSLISMAEFMNMALEAVHALAVYLQVKETSEEES